MRRFSFILVVLFLLNACTNDGKSYEDYMETITSTTWEYDVKAIVADVEQVGASNADIDRVRTIMTRLQNSKWDFQRGGVLEIGDLGTLQGGTWELDMRSSTMLITVYGTVPTTPMPILEISPDRMVLGPPEGQKDKSGLNFKRIFRPVAQPDEQK
ncbi:MAG: hypothetical protein AAF798_18870 [Bacteroidota bacterium]